MEKRVPLELDTRKSNTGVIAILPSIKIIAPNMLNHKFDS